MQGLLKEIFEIPEKARICYQKNRKIKLPINVPYLGMGSSYFASLTLFYCGKKINPQLASEYFYYLSKNAQPLGVLISQSGETSEILWNLERFKKVIAITNNFNTSLLRSKNIIRAIQLYAGQEKFPSTKTYVNTLITLYLGLGIDPQKSIQMLEDNFEKFAKQAKLQAEEIFKYIKSRYPKGLYIVGSGPNIGTACEGALTLSETTKMAWIGMSISEYDHGPKETAQNSVVIILNGNGKDQKRIKTIKKKLKTKSNALIIELVERKLLEELSPLTFITQLNLIMNYLADYMHIEKSFRLGGKITTVSNSVK